MAAVQIDILCFGSEALKEPLCVESRPMSKAIPRADRKNAASTNLVWFQGVRAECGALPCLAGHQIPKRVSNNKVHCCQAADACARTLGKTWRSHRTNGACKRNLS